jgi:hypothetical protein
VATTGAHDPPHEDRAFYEVCLNCGFEFGNDDNPGTAPPTLFEEFLAEWKAKGKPRWMY